MIYQYKLLKTCAKLTNLAKNTIANWTMAKDERTEGIRVGRNKMESLESKEEHAGQEKRGKATNISRLRVPLTLEVNDGKAALSTVCRKPCQNEGIAMVTYSSNPQLARTRVK